MDVVLNFSVFMKEHVPSHWMRGQNVQGLDLQPMEALIWRSVERGNVDPLSSIGFEGKGFSLFSHYRN